LFAGVADAGVAAAGLVPPDSVSPLAGAGPGSGVVDAVVADLASGTGSGWVAAGFGSALAGFLAAAGGFLRAGAFLVD
jgi:hypothetical protein